MLGAVAIGLGSALNDIREMAQVRGVDDVGFRRTWAELWGRVQLLRWTWFRFLSSDADTASDPRMSVLKLVSSEAQQQVARLAGDVLGPDFASGPGAERWRHLYHPSHRATNAGGTSEIHRTNHAHRVLQLPR
jgi:alkylation response protein AidB-like acyl-CoA dehydrogenase